MVSAGFSKFSISPRIGAPLAGFAARQGFCEGIHDDLCARALVIESGGKAVAFISLDVLAISSEFADGVRARIEQATGIPKDHILIASTHTHAGPVTIRTFFNPEGTLDQGYMDSLGDAIERCVSEASEKRFAARIGVGSGSVSGIGVNRRTRDKKPVDEEIGIIKVEDLSGRLRAVFMNYACHPTVLGSDNLLASGDFPYFAVKSVEEAIGEGGFAMYVNGTQGNISMGHSSELSAIGVITPGRTFEHAEELGQKLATATLDALEDIDITDSPEIGAAVGVVRFPLKKLPDMKTAAQDLQETEKELNEIEGSGAPIEEVMSAKSKRLYASITEYYSRETSELADGHLPVELQGLRIGNTMFLAVPAEVFVEIGLAIKQHSHQKVFIVGIANGYIGYLPTEAAYTAGGYEVVSSKVAPSSESVLYEEAKRLERRLFSLDDGGNQKV